MNKTILIGRLVSDPALRQTPSGISACRFTVAVKRSSKNAQGEYETDFIPCQAWRQTAEFIDKYFRKGSMIAVSGSMRNDNYKDKKYPEITHYSMYCLVENVEFCGGKAADHNSDKPSEQAAESFDYEELFSGDEPF